MIYFYSLKVSSPFPIRSFNGKLLQCWGSFLNMLEGVSSFSTEQAILAALTP
jgi:hypothetical protein